jgi:Spy/CpxP family protein refolding chaperone
MKLAKLITVAAIAVVACAAFAQGGGQGRRGFGMNMGDPITLLGREDVQKDLALSDDAKAKVVDLKEKSDAKRQEAMQAARDAANGDFAEMRKAMGPIMEKLSAENWKAVAEIITPEQLKRLKEIKVQMQGVGGVVNDKDLQKDLGITDDQKAKLKELQDRQQKAQGELFQKMQSGEVDRSEMPNIMKKNAKIMEDEVNKILTDAQKAKMTELSGKHFERVDPAPGGGL